MNQNTRFVLYVIVGVIAAYYVGAMLNFFPFLADDLEIRAIGFCTLIICTVIAVCTCVLKNKDK